MKTAILFFILLLLCCPALFSQKKYSVHAKQLQAELFGPGILFSINFDCRFLKKETGPGIRIGAGGSPLNGFVHSCNTGSLNSFPIGLNYLVGKTAHLLELGAGAALSILIGTKVYCLDSTKYFFSDKTDHYWYLSAGYRYQPVRKKGLTYRAFMSPMFQKKFATKWWGGLSVGFRF